MNNNLEGEWWGKRKRRDMNDRRQEYTVRKGAARAEKFYQGKDEIPGGVITGI